MIRWIALALFWTLSISVVSAQKVDSLRNEIKRAQQEIATTNQLLSKNKKEQQSTQRQLKLIQKNITNRKKIVSSLEEQSGLISKDLWVVQDTVTQLQNQLNTLRRQYAAMMRDSYKQFRLNTFIVFLFASKDFNQVTRRIAYMRRYNRMRVKKAAEIKALADSLNYRVVDLQEKKGELDEVFLSRSEELKSLGKDEKQYKTSVSQLTAKAGELSKTIRNKQNQVNRLQQQIQSIIADEARSSRATPRTAAQEEYIEALSGKFDQNKGLLPLPIRGGVIIDGYGTHEHATQKGLMINNKGVNIAGDPGARVYAVFEGEVTSVFACPGLNNGVMIRHGNYISVYANLEGVSVKKGDKISFNQSIGSLPQSGGEDDSTLHFEIWNETTNLNPESWLKR